MQYDNVNYLLKPVQSTHKTFNAKVFSYHTHSTKLLICYSSNHSPNLTLFPFLLLSCSQQYWATHNPYFIEPLWSPITRSYYSMALCTPVMKKCKLFRNYLHSLVFKIKETYETKGHLPLLFTSKKDKTVYYQFTSSQPHRCENSLYVFQVLPLLRGIIYISVVVTPH